MAFPTVVAGTPHNVATNQTSKTINYPAHAAEDRLLLAMCWDGNPTITSISDVGLDAWTLVTSRVAADGADAVTYIYEIVNRSGGAAAGDITVGLSATEQGVAQIWAITGSHTTEATAFASAVGTSANPDPPALNPANWDVEDTLWFAIAAWNSAQSATAFPTNYTNTDSQMNAVGMAHGRRELAAASDDPGTFTITASRIYATFTLAIRPGAGGPAQTAPNNLQVATNISQPLVTLEGIAQPNSLQVAVNISEPTTFSDPGIHGGDIPHTYVEGGHRIGPFCDANGNLYIFLEVDELTGAPFMLKSTDGGNTWAEVDQAGRPAQTDMEGADIRLVDHVMHIGVQGPSSDDVRYFTFNVSSHPTNPDEWVLNELVTLAADPLDQTTCLEIRSDGTVVIGYGGTGPTTDHVRYKVRATNGTWSAETVIESANTTNIFWQIASVMDANELIHFFISSDTGAITTRTLTTGDVLESTARTVATGLTTGQGDRLPVLPPRTYVDGSDQIVVVAYKDGSDVIQVRTITNAGTPSAATQASDFAVAKNPSGMNSRMPVATLVRDDATGELHLFYTRPDTEWDVYHAETTNGTWGTDVKEYDAVVSHAMRAEIFTHSAANGGKRVIGLYWDTGSAGLEGARYDEFLLPPVVGDATASPNDLQVAVNISEPAITQLHIVTVNNLESSVNISQPVAVVTGAIDVNSLQVASNVSQPVLIQQHFVTPDSLQVATNVQETTITQQHIVTVNSLQVAVQISEPIVIQLHIVAPQSLQIAVQIQEPSTSSTGTVQPNSLQVATNVSELTVLQQHFVTPDSLQSQVQISRPTLTVTQHLPPVQDLFVGNWETDLGATTNLFEAINEVVPDPNDFIVSDENNDPTPVVFRIQTADIPDVNTGHKIQLGAYKTSAGGMTFIPEWRSGYVSEAELGTLIYAGDAETLAETEDVFTIDVPEINAADIPDADYTAGVTIRLVPTKG